MSSYRVLVVDDNHEVRRMISASLKTLGAEIDVIDVPSAEEALVISASLPLDLVILDFRLPGMTGLDMVGRLRKRRPEARLILVTGVEDDAIRQQITQAGVEAYFFKPIEIDQFLETVKHTLWGEPPVPLPQPIAQPAAQPAIPPPVSAPLAAAEPLVSPVAAAPPAVIEIAPAAAPPPVPSLDERLSTLKQQLRAVSVLLVNQDGQVLEVAGNPSQITSGSALLSSLIQAFHAGAQVSQALGRDAGTCLQYYAGQKQCLYVAPIDTNHALFAITAGYFEAEKLASIDRYFQLAVRDVQSILASLAAAEQARQEAAERQRAALPSQVKVDKATRLEVDELFAAAGDASSQGAERYWESLSDANAPHEVHGKDTLSYEQARDIGLAPGDDKPA